MQGKSTNDTKQNAFLTGVAVESLFYGQDLGAKVVSVRSTRPKFSWHLSAGFYEAKTYVPLLTLVGIHS